MMLMLQIADRELRHTRHEVRQMWQLLRDMLEPAAVIEFAPRNRREYTTRDVPRIDARMQQIGQGGWPNAWTP